MTQFKDINSEDDVQVNVTVKPDDQNTEGKWKPQMLPREEMDVPTERSIRKEMKRRRKEKKRRKAKEEAIKYKVQLRSLDRAEQHENRKKNGYRAEAKKKALMEQLDPLYEMRKVNHKTRSLQRKFDILYKQNKNLTKAAIKDQRKGRLKFCDYQEEVFRLLNIETVKQRTITEDTKDLIREIWQLQGSLQESSTCKCGEEDEHEEPEIKEALQLQDGIEEIENQLQNITEYVMKSPKISILMKELEDTQDQFEKTMKMKHDTDLLRDKNRRFNKLLKRKKSKLKEVAIKYKELKAEILDDSRRKFQVIEIMFEELSPRNKCQVEELLASAKVTNEKEVPVLQLTMNDIEDFSEYSPNNLQ